MDGRALNNRQLGGLGEMIAAAFLQIKGYEILDRNVRYARREIDLVARDGDWVVAVEVKLRRGNRFGTAVESVDRRKISRLRVALEGIVSQSRLTLRPRIDLVLIDLNDELNHMDVNHLRGVS